MLFLNLQSVLDATCLQRKKFQSIVSTQNNLVLIDIDTWAGLGVVRYIPDVWANQTDSLPDQGKIEINNFNSEIVHRLKAMDTAFSTGRLLFSFVKHDFRTYL